VAAASKDAKSLDKVEADLKQIKSLLSGTSAEARKVKDFIANPTLSSKDKSQGIAQLLGGKEGEITR
jgi:F-type H+-transporting ATPase subunit O